MLGEQPYACDSPIYVGRVLKIVRERTFPEKPNVLFWPYLRNIKPEYVSKYHYCGNSPAAARRGLLKFLPRDRPHLDQEKWETALKWTEIHFYEALREMKVEELSIVLQDVNTSTSPGYISQLNGCKTKGDALSEGIAFDLYELYRRRALGEDCAQYDCYWSGSVKQEMRPIQKVMEDKLRLFLIAPVEHYMHQLRYSRSLTKALIKLRHHLSSCIGVTPFRLGWHEMVSPLFEKDEFGRLLREFLGETDYAEYDACMEGKDQRDLGRLFEKYLSKDPTWNEEHRKVYWKTIEDQIKSKIILPDGHVWEKETGMPSGGAWTALMNTFQNFRLFAYAFMKIVPYLPGYDDFVERVALKLMGDDDGYATSLKKFSPKRVAEVLKKDTNFIVTSPYPDFSPPSEFSFLSQKNGIHDEGFFIPIPDGTKALDSLLWHPCKNNLLDETWERLNGLRQAYFFSPEFEILEGFARQMLQKYDRRLDRTQYLNPLEIENLYLARESLCKWLPSKRIHYKSDHAIDMTTKGKKQPKKAAQPKKKAAPAQKKKPKQKAAPAAKMSIAQVNAIVKQALAKKDSTISHGTRLAVAQFLKPSLSPVCYPDNTTPNRVVWAQKIHFDYTCAADGTGGLRFVGDFNVPYATYVDGQFTDGTKTVPANPMQAQINGLFVASRCIGMCAELKCIDAPLNQKGKMVAIPNRNFDVDTGPTAGAGAITSMYDKHGYVERLATGTCCFRMFPQSGLQLAFAGVTIAHPAKEQWGGYVGITGAVATQKYSVTMNMVFEFTVRTSSAFGAMNTYSEEDSEKVVGVLDYKKFPMLSIDNPITANGGVHQQ